MRDYADEKYNRLYLKVDRVRRDLDTLAHKKEEQLALLNEVVKQIAGQQEHLRILFEELLQTQAADEDM